MENELKQYELICILNSHLEEAELDVFRQGLEKNINQLGGQIIHFKEAEKKNLAYPINKQNQGIYLISHIKLAPEKISDFSKELKSNNQILRHIISYLESLEETEKPRPIKKLIRAKKFSFVPTKVKTSEGKKEDKLKLEEIDKKLDELVGL